MPAQERLNHWRGERRRLLRELALDPENAALRNELEKVETRIRSYEDSAALPTQKQTSPDRDAPSLRPPPGFDAASADGVDQGSVGSDELASNDVPGDIAGIARAVSFRANQPD